MKCLNFAGLGVVKVPKLFGMSKDAYSNPTSDCLVHSKKEKGKCGDLRVWCALIGWVESIWTSAYMQDSNFQISFI
jgi:hypothetical protein